MTDQWRNRITGHGEEAPDQLLANPRNWRIHPKAQQDALAAVLDQVGWVQDVIVNQRTGHVVDGHARIALAISRQEPTIPVVYVDLDEAEERLILASLDPLSAMATTDHDAMRELLAEISVDDEALLAMFEKVAPGRKNGGNTDPDAVPDVVTALTAAASRGVEVRLVLESAADSAGALRFDARKAFSALEDRVRFYSWPADQRVSASGAHGALHAKAIVADGERALITSANLTGSALDVNMELGLLVEGGPIPRRLLAHFSELIARGILREAT